MTCSSEDIPPLLRERSQWVLHQDKVPYQPENPNQRADKTNSEHWSDFETAVSAAANNEEIDGIGFVVTAEDKIVGFDLDHCRDPETGEIEPWARDIAGTLDTYFEVSPSGTGLRGFAIGKLPEGRRRRGGVEIYDEAWYFTVTGNHLDGTPKRVKKRPQEIHWVHEEYLAEDETPSESNGTPSEPVDLTDQELVELIRDSKQAEKFERLWQGDTSGYKSPSEADLALCAILAFWTRCDEDRIDRLFRKSGLYRKKWNRDDYRERTIQKAVENRSEVYEPSSGTSEGGDGDATDAIDAKSEILNGGGGADQKQTDRLLDLAADVETFQTPEGEVYASFEVDHHRETWPVGSERFQMHLMRLYAKAEGETPGQEALKDACRMLKADALFEGETREVYVRVGRGDDGAIYVDLCDEKWRAIRVTGEGWSIVNRPPIRFRRSSSMEPLPVPDEEGDIEALRRFANVTPRGWRLVIAWLVAALRPEGPYPLLGLQGEQGSTKSTLARLLRLLIDPNGALLRTPSRNERDLVISAASSHVIAYDNVSALPAWHSDALCRLSTGGGFATRELYTDRGEIVFDETRPAIITSIEDVVTRADLADRAIRLTLEPVSEGERMTERELYESFNEVAPAILAGLLDAVACAERRIDEVELEDLPRMADFAEWIVAAEPALPWEEGEFMQAYGKNRSLAVMDNVQMNPLATGIADLIEEAPDDQWQGSPSELLEQLDEIVPESDQASQAYPGGPSWVTRKLERVKPMLRKIGIEVEDDLRIEGRRVVRITSDNQQTSDLGSMASMASPSPEESGERGESEGDGQSEECTGSEQDSTSDQDSTNSDEGTGDDQSLFEDPPF